MRHVSTGILNRSQTDCQAHFSAHCSAQSRAPSPVWSPVRPPVRRPVQTGAQAQRSAIQVMVRAAMPRAVVTVASVSLALLAISCTTIQSTDTQIPNGGESDASTDTRLPTVVTGSAADGVAASDTQANSETAVTPISPTQTSVTLPSDNAIEGKSSTGVASARPLIEPLKAPLSAEQQLAINTDNRQVTVSDVPAVVLMANGNIENGVETYAVRRVPSPEPVTPAPVRPEPVTPDTGEEPVTETEIESDVTPVADADSDGDGIGDSSDLCAATSTGLRVSANGCLIPVGTFDALGFVTGRAILDADGRRLLDELAQALNRDPTGRVAVVTHPEQTSGDAAAALLLAKRRTLAVVRYLIERSVESSRIVPTALETQELTGADLIDRVSMVEFRTLPK